VQKIAALHLLKWATGISPLFYPLEAGEAKFFFLEGAHRCRAVLDNGARQAARRQHDGGGGRGGAAGRPWGVGAVRRCGGAESGARPTAEEGGASVRARAHRRPASSAAQRSCLEELEREGAGVQSGVPRECGCVRGGWAGEGGKLF
jgi:hypothetical protein